MLIILSHLHQAREFATPPSYAGPDSPVMMATREAEKEREEKERDRRNRKNANRHTEIGPGSAGARRDDEGHSGFVKRPDGTRVERRKAKSLQLERLFSSEN